MFNKVLIANRGTIACRIIRTLRRLGVGSVVVYSKADARSRHVAEADEAHEIGEALAAESYLDWGKLFAVAKLSGAEAIHPGYGFLSENADFAEACAREGLVFIGPTPGQMRDFGLKHTARALAEAAGLPLLPGTGLLADLPAALAAAQTIGYPVMLKSTAGGGGIGMQLCRSEAELTGAFESVRRLSENNFKNAGLFLEKFVERARHIEVQLFGDGQGKVLALGERDCSLQRRNQKVVEETPAPNIDPALRAQLLDSARRLGESVAYRSAGTVEYVFDADAGAFYFLEVNTRLQVEHGVTEEVTGVDLVEWMLRLAAGELPDLDSFAVTPHGHAIQVRVYAEDPAKRFQPSSGLLTQVSFPDGIRADTWVEQGVEVSPYYDPMLAKLIVKADDRAQAIAGLTAALDASRLYGIETNLEYLRAVVRDALFHRGEQYTRYLNDFAYQPHSVDVLEAGTQTTVQDVPGRLGYWDVGVPPSGPMDDLAFRLGNRILGNPEAAAGLELTVTGPTLKFNCDSVICLTGAAMTASLDGEPLAYWQAVPVRAGQTLKIGHIGGAGARSYLTFKGGLDVPEYLGSRATFTLGQFGGHGGRHLRVGDVLRIAPAAPDGAERAIDPALIPNYRHHWEIRVIYGPHGAPDFFTDEDIATFFATDWKVHYNSSRTGVRLIGPKPTWARPDGGEAGLHPSNIHDNAYGIGSVDFTGDMPVILGPDGPSLGGFVCPATIIRAERWKLGQLRPGDSLRFVPVDMDSANRLEDAQLRAIAELAPVSAEVSAPAVLDPVLARLSEADNPVAVCYRPSGDHYLLVEYGPLVLDIALRFRVHALMLWLQQEQVRGIIDLTPGIRSLQVHYDSRVLPLKDLLTLLARAERELGDVAELEVPARVVHLPLAWNDSQTRLAIEKYMQSVRADAPWCPSNLEFIRRINGLASIDEVKRIVFDARYLVMGLGDVYLGAPVATPLDPRHRLVTTKYNPARTWTPENAVGIGGSYLCVYGMEGPGGYQFVGRTVQMWNRWKTTRNFDKPWLLEFFDQIRFYEVSEEELLQMREDFPRGRLELTVEPTRFSLKDYQRYLADNADSIRAFKAKQQAAFDAERERWLATGQAHYEAQEPEGPQEQDGLELLAGETAVSSHIHGSVWRVAVTEGQAVKEGEVLFVLECMKMELTVTAPRDGVVTRLLCKQGSQLLPGQQLVVLGEA